MNQFIEKQQFVVLTPISIGLDSLDIEQEIPYLTEGDIERNSLPQGHRALSKNSRTTGRFNGSQSVQMKTQPHSPNPQTKTSPMPGQLESLGYMEAYNTVSIKPGVKVWGKFMPNGSVYLLNSFRGTDFFCSICAKEVSTKLLSLQSIEDPV